MIIFCWSANAASWAAAITIAPILLESTVVAGLTIITAVVVAAIWTRLLIAPIAP